MQVPENLYDLINETTSKATSVVFTKPELKKVVQKGQNYLISYIESLKKKDEITEEKKKQKVNPFDNPDKEQVVLKDKDYTIVLNKFPVIKNHFLLITNEFVKQDSLLQPGDLQVMHNILKTLSKAKDHGRTVAFFNSGSQSGFSQPHKHIQFTFVEDPEYELFPDKVVAHQKQFVPNPDHPPLSDESKSFANFILPLKTEDGSEISAEDFALMYITLIQSCLTVIKDHHISDKLQTPQSESLSYNLLMTSDWLMVVPRSQELVEVDGYAFSINSLSYIGMILVKNRDAFTKLTSEDFLIEDTILEKGGFVRSYEKPDKEGDY